MPPGFPFSLHNHFILRVLVTGLMLLHVHAQHDREGNVLGEVKPSHITKFREDMSVGIMCRHQQHKAAADAAKSLALEAARPEEGGERSSKRSKSV